MAIVNRDYSDSGQRQTFQYQLHTALGTGLALPIGIMPCACQLLTVVSGATGLSGAPKLALQAVRFIPGVGKTLVSLNSLSLLTVQAFATSGIQRHAVGASTFLLAGDVLQVLTSVANTGAFYYNFTAVIEILQDIKSDYGV